MRKILFVTLYVTMALSTQLYAYNCVDSYLQTANKHLEEGDSEKAENEYNIYKRASSKTDVSFEQSIVAAKNSLSDQVQDVEQYTPEVNVVNAVQEEYRQQAIADKRVVTKELADFINSLNIIDIHGIGEYVYIDAKSFEDRLEYQDFGIILGGSSSGYTRRPNGKKLEGNLSTHAGLRRVVDEKSGKWGYTDKDWDLVIPCKYEEAGHFSDDGLAAVAERDLLGYIKNLRYIDKNGEVIIKGFDAVDNHSLEQHRFSSGYAVVGKYSKKYKYGFAYLIIDTLGGIVAELDISVYSPGPYSIHPVKEGLILAYDTISSGYIYYNLKGEVVLKNIKGAGPFSCGLAKTEKGYINKRGDTVIPEVYRGTSFYYGVALVQRTKDSVHEIINTSGEKLYDIELPYNNSWCGFNESGYIWYYNQDLDRWGLADTLGNSTFDYL